MKRIMLPLIIVLAASLGAQAGPDLTSARIYRNQGDLGKAISFFDLEIQKNPEGYAAYFERGEVFGMIAMDASKKGVLRDLAGDSDEPQKVILQKMLDDFRVVQAVEDEKTRKKLKTELKKIDAILEDYWAVFYNAAVAADTVQAAAVAAGDTARAGAAADQAALATDLAILLNPMEWNAHALRGQVLDRMGKVTEANEVWATTKALLESSGLKEQEPDRYAMAWTVIQQHRLQNYYDADDYEMTVKVADEILAEDTTSVDATVFRAFALTNMLNKPDVPEEEKSRLRELALPALKTAHEATPEDAAITFYLAQFYLEAADTAAAIEWYRTYTELDTLDQEVVFHLGYLYLEGGSYKDYAKAEAIYQSMVNRFPNNCDAWINLGVAQINQDRTAIGAENVNKGKDCKAKAGK